MSLSFVYPQYLWLFLTLPLFFGLAWISPLRAHRGRFWASSTARLVVLTALILALAGIQVRLNSNLITTVFVLDASDSLTPEQRALGEAYIRNAIADMKADQNAAIVVFGEEAMVDRLPSDSTQLLEITTVPVTSRTDIASALQLAQAILPDEGSRRIVLLSDGRENLGRAIEQSELAAANQIEVSYVPLGHENGRSEVYLESLVSPGEIRRGQEFNLSGEVVSTGISDAELRLFANDRLVKTVELRLLPGSNHFEIPIKAEDYLANGQDAGSLLRFKAQAVADLDELLQNNLASSFTIVRGKPSVLIVEDQPGDGQNIAAALDAAGMVPVTVSPHEMPNALDKLADYESILLVGVPAGSLPEGVMNTLQVYVRDLGKGLVMVGGPESFGAGGYLRTPLEKALPVDMDVRDKEIQSNLALVLAVDKSGSMGRCHCDNPDLNQTYTPQLTGQAKVDIAKEAVMRASAALSEQDLLGVLAFDTQPRWAVDLGPLVDQVDLENSISAFQAEGQTNLQAGIMAAYNALQKVQARRKHIILMTDGWVRTGELNSLAQEMRDQGITLSIVAAGEGSAEYLSSLATLGGGAFYPATNIQNVPDIFLKETIQSVGEYVIEEPFFPIQSAPSAVMRGLDPSTMPPLLGYNGTSAKKTARLDLITPRGDPLLASWQYGLGRTAIWTSDLKGQWAARWLGWDGFPRFVSQLVGWTLPADKAEGLSIEAALRDNEAIISVEAANPDGSPRNFLSGSVSLIDPDYNQKELAIKQVGSGKYEARSQVSMPGVYLVRVGINDGDQSLGQSTLGLVVPYSPEYKTSGVDRALLSQLAFITGGRELAESADAFVQNLPSIPSTREIWLPLLILAALLFPIDVGVRRLTLRRKDLSQAADWVKSALPTSSRQTRAPQPRLLSNLFEARQRVRREGAAKQEGDEPPSVLDSDRQKKPAVTPPSGDQPAGVQDTGDGATTETSAIDRLKAAKKRARH